MRAVREVEECRCGEDGEGGLGDAADGVHG